MGVYTHMLPTVSSLVALPAVCPDPFTVTCLSAPQRAAPLTPGLLRCTSRRGESSLASPEGEDSGLDTPHSRPRFPEIQPLPL